MVIISILKKWHFQAKKTLPMCLVINSGGYGVENEVRSIADREHKCLWTTIWRKSSLENKYSWLVSIYLSMGKKARDTFISIIRCDLFVEHSQEMSEAYYSKK